jgi:hypothetical protein
MIRVEAKPCRVDGQAGWLLPSGMLPSGAESLVLVVDPTGASKLVKRNRIVLGFGGAPVTVHFHMKKPPGVPVE